MLTLALDTATRTLAVALVQDQQVLAQAAEPAAQSHAERLPELLTQLLTESSLSRHQITQVAVGVGPGAYTGLRVGLMFATAFARAREISLVGICTHDAIAPDDYTGLVVTDARRKEVYLSKYENGARISAPIVTRPAEIALRDLMVIGDGVTVFPKFFPTGIPTEISAGVLGQRVNALLAAGETAADLLPNLTSASSDGAGAIPQNASALLPALPLYLRRPDVMEPK
jgi:tRNA threonylcarbamoyladenosine biosynthesis protein TsaB